MTAFTEKKNDVIFKVFYLWVHLSLNIYLQNFAFSVTKNVNVFLKGCCANVNLILKTWLSDALNNAFAKIKDNRKGSKKYKL